jgi:hypothetical protein
MILRYIGILLGRERDAFESVTLTFLPLDRIVSHQSAVVHHVIISTVLNVLQLRWSCGGFTYNDAQMRPLCYPA